jgi:hypothetical protein
MAPNLAGCRIDEVASFAGTALHRMIGVRLFARSWIVGLALHCVPCPRTPKFKEPHEEDCPLRSRTMKHASLWSLTGHGGGKRRDVTPASVRNA